MNLEITGKLLDKGETVQVKETFRKREFVLELTEEINGSPYTNYAKMQLVQTKCDILDRFQVGDMLRVNFNIKGNRYERDGKVNYFSNLDAWRIEKADVNNGNNNSGGYNNNSNNSYNNNNSNSNNSYNNNNSGGFNNNGGGNSNNANAYQSSPSNTAAGADSDDLPF